MTLQLVAQAITGTPNDLLKGSHAALWLLLGASKNCCLLFPHSSKVALACTVNYEDACSQFPPVLAPPPAVSLLKTICGFVKTASKGSKSAVTLWNEGWVFSPRFDLNFILYNDEWKFSLFSGLCGSLKTPPSPICQLPGPVSSDHDPIIKWTTYHTVNLVLLSRVPCKVTWS